MKKQGQERDPDFLGLGPDAGSVPVMKMISMTQWILANEASTIEQDAVRWCLNILPLHLTGQDVSIHLTRSMKFWYRTPTTFLSDMQVMMHAERAKMKAILTLCVTTVPCLQFEITDLQLQDAMPERTMWPLDPMLIPDIRDEDIRSAVTTLSGKQPVKIADELHLPIVPLALYGYEGIPSCLVLEKTDMLVDKTHLDGWPDLKSLQAPCIVINTNAVKTEKAKSLAIFHECIHALWHRHFYGLWAIQTKSHTELRDRMILIAESGMHPLAHLEMQAKTACEIWQELHDLKMTDPSTDVDCAIERPEEELTFGRFYSDESYLKRTSFYLDSVMHQHHLNVFDAQRVYIRSFPDSFHEALCLLMRQAGRKTEEFSQAVGISERAMIRLRNEEKDQYSLEEVMRILLELQLPPWLGEMLLASANIRLGNSLRHRILYFIVHAAYMDGVEHADRLLQEAGVQSLTGKVPEESKKR